MRHKIAYLFLFGMVVCGCSQEQENVMLSASDLQLCPCQTNLVVGTERKIAQLGSNDVIVAVNDVPLTKYDYDRMMEFRLRKINERKGMNNLLAEKLFDDYRRSYPRMFVTQRLLVDEAFRAKVVTTNEVLVAVGNVIKAVSKKRGIPAEQFMRSLGTKKSYYIYELAVEYVMNKYISEKVKPKAEVNQDFLDAVKEAVKKSNDEAQQFNDRVRKALTTCRQKILSREITFEEAASRAELMFAGHAPEGGSSHVWGTFGLSEIDDPTTAAVSFDLPINGISEVIEEENGFCLVRVDRIFPLEHDDDGATVLNERRELSRIYVEKAPMMIEQGDVALTQDLKQQMQMQAIDECVGNLMTNGVNKVVYPNGPSLF